MLMVSIGCLVNVYGLPTNASEAVIGFGADILKTEPALRCNVDQDCSGHGRCMNETGCVCDRGWTTVNYLNDTATACAYQQRSKPTAFVLSLILGPVGADWFYLSRKNLAYIIIGIFKLLVGCGCCTSWPLRHFGSASQSSEVGKVKLQYIASSLTLTSIIWWIVDVIRILANRFPDGRGVELLGW